MKIPGSLILWRTYHGDDISWPENVPDKAQSRTKPDGDNADSDGDVDSEDGDGDGKAQSCTITKTINNKISVKSDIPMKPKNWQSYNILKPSSEYKWVERNRNGSKIHLGHLEEMHVETFHALCLSVFAQNLQWY